MRQQDVIDTQSFMEDQSVSGDAREPVSTAQLTRAERYWSQLQDAQKELNTLAARIEEIDQEKSDLERRVLELSTVIGTLEPIYAEQRREEEGKLEQEHIHSEAEWKRLAVQGGIQECCYRVLLESEEPLPAWAIRFALEEKGIDLRGYANSLAVIHTSLKRIPERVRSYKGRNTDSTGRTTSVRYYEVIRERAAGAVRPAK